jgi:hypothetical protein
MEAVDFTAAADLVVAGSMAAAAAADFTDNMDY